jgi:hypothetical protein
MVKRSSFLTASKTCTPRCIGKLSLVAVTVSMMPVLPSSLPIAFELSLWFHRGIPSTRNSESPESEALRALPASVRAQTGHRPVIVDTVFALRVWKLMQVVAACASRVVGKIHIAVAVVVDAVAAFWRAVDLVIVR